METEPDRKTNCTVIRPLHSFWIYVFVRKQYLQKYPKTKNMIVMLIYVVQLQPFLYLTPSAVDEAYFSCTVISIGCLESEIVMLAIK